MVINSIHRASLFVVDWTELGCVIRHTLWPTGLLMMIVMWLQLYTPIHISAIHRLATTIHDDDKPRLVHHAPHPISCVRNVVASGLLRPAASVSGWQCSPLLCPSLRPDWSTCEHIYVGSLYTTTRLPINRLTEFKQLQFIHTEQSVPRKIKNPVSPTWIGAVCYSNNLITIIQITVGRS